jgi:hypothetical protein
MEYCYRASLSHVRHAIQALADNDELRSAKRAYSSSLLALERCTQYELVIILLRNIDIFRCTGRMKSTHDSPVSSFYGTITLVKRVCGKLDQLYRQH